MINLGQKKFQVLVVMSILSSITLVSAVGADMCVERRLASVLSAIRRAGILEVVVDSFHVSPQVGGTTV